MWLQEKNWLLIKMNGNHADALKNLVKSCPESIKSGKTIEVVKLEKEK